MNTISKKTIYYIDSHSRLSGEHNDFMFNIDFPPDVDYTHCCLLSAVIPKSYYLIQAGINTFVLRENNVNTTIIFLVCDNWRYR